MKRRDFLYMAAGAAAISTFGPVRRLEARIVSGPTTPFFVRGLAMLKFNDPNYLQVALPEAPHHAATLITRTPTGGELARKLEGDMVVVGDGAAGTPLDVQLPELIQMRELYKGAVGRFEGSPTRISIPWSAVGGVSTHEVSEDRWTFVWADSGAEVESFRPRKVAESVRIDLVSSSVLSVNDGEFTVPMADLAEAWTDFTPTREGMGDFSDHFAFYMPYVRTAEEIAEVVPKKVGRQARRSGNPSFGNGFAASRIYPFAACFLVEVD